VGVAVYGSSGGDAVEVGVVYSDGGDVRYDVGTLVGVGVGSEVGNLVG